MDHDHRPPHHHSHHYSVSNHRGSYKDSGFRATMVKGVSLRNSFSLAAILARYGLIGSSASIFETAHSTFSLLSVSGSYGAK